MMSNGQVFVTGGTGYMGSRLVRLLVENGLAVRALVRPGSERKLPPGCTAVPGDALRGESFVSGIAPAKTFVQLVGVAHPSPAKAKEFREIDLVSAQASITAARSAGIEHFVYVSVAHPAPVMRSYIEVRREGEKMLRESGMNGTILRPWYVLGPGHRWPYALLPVYWMCERIPGFREGARRLGLVRLDEMLRALTEAVKSPSHGIRVWEVPDIRAASFRPGGG